MKICVCTHLFEVCFYWKKKPDGFNLMFNGLNHIPPSWLFAAAAAAAAAGDDDNDDNEDDDDGIKKNFDNQRIKKREVLSSLNYFLFKMNFFL